MKKSHIAASVLLAVAGFAPLAALAQNVAVVNGKPVPKARVDAIISQVQKQAQQRNQQLPPDIDKLVRDKVVTDEILSQEAERRGLAASADFKSQMEIARQSILIGMLSTDLDKRTTVSDAEIQVEYDKFKAQSSGTEYRARHILVEKEDDAKALVAQLKSGAKFEDLAKKNSKDPGSAENGGDLDFAAPSAYVPEFSQAMVKLKKGDYTDVPVKTQFGFHIIKLEDTREAKFPPLAEVKPQIQQRLAQRRRGGHVRMRRPGPYHDADAGPRQVHPAARRHHALLDQVLKRIADHDEHIDRLATRQPGRDGIDGLAHRRTPSRADAVARRLLPPWHQRAIGCGKPARTDDPYLRRQRRPGQQQRRKAQHDATAQHRLDASRRVCLGHRAPLHAGGAVDQQRRHQPAPAAERHPQARRRLVARPLDQHRRNRSREAAEHRRRQRIRQREPGRAHRHRDHLGQGNHHRAVVAGVQERQPQFDFEHVNKARRTDEPFQRRVCGEDRQHREELRLLL
mgnify:CR=1 FL=1